jgi:pyridoxal phosphate enzyme (YggS family)
MNHITDSLGRVREEIALLEARHDRPPDSVRLLAVSKGHGPEALRAAWTAGQRAFGESYLQQALPKMQAVADLDIEWHFIGRLQSNKTRSVAEHFHWLHSLDRGRIARRLSAQRPPSLPPLNCCLEIRLDEDTAKGGIDLANLDSLAELVSELPGLTLRGLMTIPARTDECATRDIFERLAGCYTRLQTQYPALDTLSMGMSADMAAAIAAGSTLVRIGTAIFGPRTTN